MKANQMVTTKFRDAVVKLLRERPATLKLKQVAEDTTIPEGWLKRLNQQRIDAPDPNRLETLYEYLTGKKLEF